MNVHLNDGDGDGDGDGDSDGDGADSIRRLRNACCMARVVVLLGETKLALIRQSAATSPPPLPLLPSSIRVSRAVLLGGWICIALRPVACRTS